MFPNDIPNICFRKVGNGNEKQFSQTLGLGMEMKNWVLNPTLEKIEQRVLEKSWERELPLMSAWQSSDSRQTVIMAVIRQSSDIHQTVTIKVIIAAIRQSSWQSSGSHQDSHHGSHQGSYYICHHGSHQTVTMTANIAVTKQSSRQSSSG